MTASDDTKICGLCGQDCSDRPRTRDRGGRYFCKQCYEAAAARQKSGRSETALLADTHDVDATVLAAILEDTAAHASLPPDVPEVCSRCGKSYEAGSTVCTRCGHKAKPPKKSGPSSSSTPPPSRPDFMLPVPARGPSWHIPTWLIIGVPLVLIIVIVLAAMPRSRRTVVPPAPTHVVPGRAEATAPDLAKTQSFESDTLRFRYPGNWRLDTGYPGFDRESYVVVDNGRDAQVIIRVFESTDTPEAALATRLEDLGGFGAGYTDRARLGAYGALKGAGREVTTYLGSVPVRNRIFIAKLSIHSLVEIHEVCPEPEMEHADAGFDFLAKSLLAK